MDLCKSSPLGRLNLSDWQKGLIVAMIMAPLTIIYESVQQGSLVFNWKAILAAALGGGLSYLIKNLATGGNGQLLTNEPAPLDLPPKNQPAKP